MADHAAVAFIVLADWNNGPVVDAEAEAKGNAATSDCLFEE